MLTPDAVKTLILDLLPDATVDVNSYDNVHFDAVIVSEAFEGLSPVKRQQLIYSVLQPHIQSGALHAIALKTKAPNE